MQDKVVFSLSDRSGELRFESFDAVNAPELEPSLRPVREYLLGRSLSEIETKTLNNMLCHLGDDERNEMMILIERLIEVCARRTRSRERIASAPLAQRARV